MFKVLKAIKDTYVTNRVIKGTQMVSASLGKAGTLDVFKLYGETVSGSTPNLELSRAMIQFDLSGLENDVNSGLVDVNSNSFFAKLQLKDVYGGQPTPENFTIKVFPLSASFIEGRGKDVVTYSDRDAANFISSSINVLWNMSGCGLGGGPTDACDFITGTYAASQHFPLGIEDLDVDVTTAISATIAGVIPNRGFRISYDDTIENDKRTYFVKRFASRHAYDETKRPRLVYGYDDSIRDDSSFLAFGSTNTIFFYSYDHGALANVFSGSTEITGAFCMNLKLSTPVSGTTYSEIFSASQHKNFTGIYSASFVLNLTSSMLTALNHSGSVSFTPSWESLDGSVTYYTGEQIKFWRPRRTTTVSSPTRYAVTVNGIDNVLRSDEQRFIRVNVFDHTSPYIVASRVPVNSPDGIRTVAEDAFYSVRDVLTNEAVIPFDTSKGSTRLSSDSMGSYFTLNTTALYPERRYVIDILLIAGGRQQKYLNASSVFKVSDLQ